MGFSDRDQQGEGADERFFRIAVVESREFGRVDQELDNLFQGFVSLAHEDHSKSKCIRKKKKWCKLKCRVETIAHVVGHSSSTGPPCLKGPVLIVEEGEVHGLKNGEESEVDEVNKLICSSRDSDPGHLGNWSTSDQLCIVVENGGMVNHVHWVSNSPLGEFSLRFRN